MISFLSAASDRDAEPPSPHSRLYTGAAPPAAPPRASSPAGGSDSAENTPRVGAPEEGASPSRRARGKVAFAPLTAATFDPKRFLSRRGVLAPEEEEKTFSIAVFPPQMRYAIAQFADANHDGTVTSSELAKAAEMYARVRHAHGAEASPRLLDPLAFTSRNHIAPTAALPPPPKNEVNFSVDSFPQSLRDTIAMFDVDGACVPFLAQTGRVLPRRASAHHAMPYPHP